MMKTLVACVVAFVFSCVLSVEGMVEISAMREILPEVTQDTLVLLDIDDTCVKTESMLGSNPWWHYFTQKMISAHFDMRALSQSVFPLVGKISQSISLSPVEEEIPSLIQALQNQNITVWGFTGRITESPYDPHFDATTHAQLQKAGINFEKSVSPASIHLKSISSPKIFAFGILFASHQLKGNVLKKFLKETHYKPTKIVVVDDMASQLESVEQTLKEMNIPHTCFRYNHLDKSKALFDPLISNLQLKALLTQGYVPTDEQTASWKSELMKTKPNLGEDFYLEELIMNIKNIP